MDLDDRQVIKVIDTGVIPVPANTQNFDEATVASRYGLRPALKPVTMAQPQGVNFTLDGNFIEWQKWRFHLRFERRSGTVISLANYDGRPVLYQGSLAEIFVPYQDPGRTGSIARTWTPGSSGSGCCPPPSRSGWTCRRTRCCATRSSRRRSPIPSCRSFRCPCPNVVGVFERLTGSPVWRHFELFSNGAYEGRAEVELVVRSISQLGNYDYMVDWIFTQRGSIRVEVGLTGIDAAEGCRGRDSR